MRDRPDNKTEALDRATRLSWQTDHEGAIHYCGQVTRENGVLSNFHRFDPHHLAEPRQFANGDFADCFGSHITQGDARAAGRQYKLAALGDEFADAALDLALFVRHQRLGYNLPAIT